MEEELKQFESRVRDGYLEIAGREPNRFLVLDATRPEDEVHSRIWERVRGLLDLAPPVVQPIARLFED